MARDFSVLNDKILHKEAGQKVLWQPRIDCWLGDRKFRGEALPGKFADCNNWAELYDKLDVSARTYDPFNSCLGVTRDDSVKFRREEIDETSFRNVYETPVGTISEVLASNDSNPGLYYKKWLVENEDDLKVMIYLEEATRYHFDIEYFEGLKKQYGRYGSPALFMPRTTIQKLFVELSGVENSIYLLMDAPDTVDEYFKVLRRKQAEACRVLADTPFQWINYGDNIHSKVLSPQLFEKYILPAYEERYDILHNQGGKFVYAHFDGDVEELLPYAKTCFLDGIEAVTPKPQGDVTLKDVKKAFGDEVYLIDGIAAILFQEDFPLEMLKEQTEECLNLFAGRLILGISDEMSSMGTLDRIEYVRDMVDEWNAKH